MSRGLPLSQRVSRVAAYGVRELLPGADCGACGEAGCRAFAAAVSDLRRPGLDGWSRLRWLREFSSRHRRFIASLIMSAAVPWIGALIA